MGIIKDLYLPDDDKAAYYIDRTIKSAGRMQTLITDLLILKVKTFLKIYEQQNELKVMKELLSKEIKIRKEAQENLEIKIAERTKELVLKNEALEFNNHELQNFHG